MDYGFNLSLFDNISAPMGNIMAAADMLKTKVNELPNSFESVTKSFSGLSSISDQLKFDGLNQLRTDLLSLVPSESKSDIKQLTDAYEYLTANGIEPTMQDMQRMADLAHDAGLEVKDLAKGLLDVGTGDLSGIAKAGVKATPIEGNKVEVTYKGNKQVIDNDASAIRAYILALGDLDSVKDRFGQTQKTIGERFDGFIERVPVLRDKVVNAYEFMNNSIITSLENTSPYLSDFVKDNATLFQNFGIDVSNSIVDNLRNIVPGAAYVFDSLSESLASYGIDLQNSGQYYDNFVAGIDKINNVKNAFGEFYEGTIGGLKNLSPVFDTFFTNLEGKFGDLVSNKISGMTTGLKSIGSSMLKVGLDALKGIGFMVLSLVDATAAQLGLNLAMTANPIGLIIAGIVGVGVAIYGIVVYWDKIKVVLSTVFDYLWSPFKMLLDGIKIMFPEFYQTVVDWFTKSFDWILSKVMWIKDAILGIFSTGETKDPTADDTQTVNDNMTDDGSSYESDKFKTKAKDKSYGVNKGHTPQSEPKGGNIKNITINLPNGLVGKMSVVTTPNERPNKVNDEMQRVLLTLMNDINQM